MTEAQPTHKSNNIFAVVKTYSLTMQQVSRVADLAQRLQVNQSEIVRNAIDRYYEVMNHAIDAVKNNDGHES